MFSGMNMNPFKNLKQTAPVWVAAGVFTAGWVYYERSKAEELQKAPQAEQYSEAEMVRLNKSLKTGGGLLPVPSKPVEKPPAGN